MTGKVTGRVDLALVLCPLFLVPYGPDVAAELLRSVDAYRETGMKL